MISSVWTLQTAILNCRANLLLVCMSSPDGECRSVSYGVMKIWELVAIVPKCKMGGCEHHYLYDLGSAHPFKNWLKQSTQKGEMGCWFKPIFMRSSTEGASHPDKMNLMHADLQIEVENGFS